MADAKRNGIKVWVNGAELSVPPDCTAAAAVARAGVTMHRRSVEGHARGPLCGMGVCMECRVTINGELHQRGCQTLCMDGMRIETAEVASDA
ncbi:(2Fe-2S)-binding protein [Candidatus Sumerlaeota bacterium]|nr:(2Fe-2S)-binding protein [Candidatus Sumerlaeota bacterium]